jgi:hypothetical protein
MNRRMFLKAVGSAELVSFAKKANAADPALVRATQAVVEAIPLAEADRDRPVHHFHPPANWTNDPNGTLYYRGWHHLNLVAIHSPGKSILFSDNSQQA